MKYVFICEKCGNLQKYNDEQGTRELKCKACNDSMDWENSFPPLSAIDFINSSRNLLEQLKNVIGKTWNKYINSLRKMENIILIRQYWTNIKIFMKIYLKNILIKMILYG